MYEKYGFMVEASVTICSKPIFETIHFLPRSHPQCVQFVFALTSHWSVGKPICFNHFTEKALPSMFEK